MELLLRVEDQRVCAYPGVLEESLEGVEGDPDDEHPDEVPGLVVPWSVVHFVLVAVVPVLAPRRVPRGSAARSR